MYNRVIQGDCTAVLKTLPGESVDFVLTDPPYFVRYKDRSGRTIRNDRYPGQILDAFNDVYRVLKPNSLCVSFYGWNRVDSFFTAWKGAGFTPVGHIVFSKTYASAQRFLRYPHEAAYVLAKGRPELPAARSATCCRGTTPAITTIRPKRPSTRSCRSSKLSPRPGMSSSTRSPDLAAAWSPPRSCGGNTSASSLSRNTATTPGGAWPALPCPPRHPAARATSGGENQEGRSFSKWVQQRTERPGLAERGRLGLGRAIEKGCWIAARHETAAC